VKKYSRRQLLVMGTGAGATLVGVMLSIPAVGFLLSPLFTKRRIEWVSVGPIDDVPVGQPQPLYVLLPNDSGWPTPPERRVVYVVKKPDGTLHAFSNICTHMQCDVHWEERLSQFLCPCHGGLYDIDGNNIGGPPPQPLPQWVHRVRLEPQSQRHILEIQNQLEESV